VIEPKIELSNWVNKKTSPMKEYLDVTEGCRKILRSKTVKGQATKG
jgi:hypothetical protein